MKLCRYQVLDELGHPCDIRTWSQAIKDALAESYPTWHLRPRQKPSPQPRFRIDPIGWGSKRKHGYCKAKSFVMQKLRDVRNKFELDLEDDLSGHVPVRDHSKPRILDQSYRDWKKSDHKCWKTSSKKKNQWERHKKDTLDSRSLTRDEEYELAMAEEAEALA